MAKVRPETPAPPEYVTVVVIYRIPKHCRIGYEPSTASEGGEAFDVVDNSHNHVPPSGANTIYVFEPGLSADLTDEQRQVAILKHSKDVAVVQAVASTCNYYFHRAVWDKDDPELSK